MENVEIVENVEIKLSRFSGAKTVLWHRIWRQDLDYILEYIFRSADGYRIDSHAGSQGICNHNSPILSPYLQKDHTHILPRYCSSHTDR